MQMRQQIFKVSLEQNNKTDVNIISEVKCAKKEIDFVIFRMILIFCVTTFRMAKKVIPDAKNMQIILEVLPPIPKHFNALL